MTIAFSPDGKQLASGSKDDTVRLWETATGALQRILEGQLGWIETIAFSPDGKQLASGSDNNTVRLWETATGILLRNFDVNTVRELAFAADGSYIQTNCGQIQRLTDSIRTQTELILPTGWTINRDWLVRDNRKMLRLPSSFRYSRKAQRDCLFAFGHESGEITLLNLSDPNSSDTHSQWINKSLTVSKYLKSS